MRLNLRKDTLAELRSDELAAIAGAAGTVLTDMLCLAEPTHGVCESVLEPCVYISNTCTPPRP